MNVIMNMSPDELLNHPMMFSPGEHDRAQRIRIYQFITLVEEILRNGFGK